MTVIRIHKNKNFTIMSNFHFKEKKMSLKAKGLLSLMLSLPDDWNYTIAGLVSLSKDGKDAVMAALQELENFGYLTRQRIKLDNGQFSGVEYNIYEEPQKNIPVSEKTNEEFQKSGKTNSGNPPLLNTNSINNLFNELYNELNTNDEELILLYKEYIKMRETLESPLTLIGLQKVIKKCKKMSYGNTNIEKLILENSLINNWKDIYLPSERQLDALNQEYVADFKAMFELE